MGPNGVNTVHRVQIFFLQKCQHHMPKQVFWCILSSWWAVLALLESQNALKMGQKFIFQDFKFWDEKWVKNGSKRCFSKNDPRPFGVPKQVK